METGARKIADLSFRINPCSSIGFTLKRKNISIMMNANFWIDAEKNKINE